jgi:hypothetical protein
MRTFTWNITMTKTLTEALCNQRPIDITVYTGTHKNLDAFAHIPTASADEMARIEADEQLRRELPLEQRIAINQAYREFADELQDAEAEAGIAASVWQVREGQFTNAQFTAQ